MSKFIGRQTELRLLKDITQLKKASFLIVKGRRRIGKSALIKEFGKNFDAFYSFSGLTPDQHTTHQQQLDEFSRQMSRELNMPFAQYNDWSDIFWSLADRLKKRQNTFIV